MKISRLLTLIAFLAILMMATHQAIDSDTWWHLRSGQWMVENRAVITEDSFSLTRAGTPWQYPGLWIQAAMFLVFDAFGPGGLNLWVSLTVVTIFIFVWLTMRGSTLGKVGVLLLAAASSAVYWAARPYLVTYLLAAIFFYYLEMYYRDGRGKLWLLPVMMVVWVNSHGGYLAGFLVLTPYLADALITWITANRQGEDPLESKSKFKHLGLIGGLMLAATLVNPAGPGLWALPFSTVSRQAEQLFIAEWQSPDFHQVYLLPFAVMLSLLLVVMGGTKKKFQIYELLLVAGFGLLGLYSVRNIFFFVIVAPAVLIQGIDSLVAEWKGKFRITRKLELDGKPSRFQSGLHIAMVFLFAVLAAGRVAAYLASENNWEEISQSFPVAAVEYIREKQPEGNLFNSYNYGGYLIWALPEYPVFVDGRADLHQDKIIMEWYRTIILAGDWGAVLDEWGIGVVLLEPEQPLVRELVDLGWQLGYADELAVVLIKD
ncbi:MAG: hypothetical protein ABFS17_05555 [Chloroflexota bacterium]